MFFFKRGEVEYVCLTFIDEKKLAKTVMDCIAVRWISGEFQSLLDKIYEMKCSYGFYLDVRDLDRLLYFIEDKYVVELAKLGIHAPDLEDTDRAIWSDFDSNDFASEDDKRIETRNMTRIAWKEVWDGHDQHKAVASSYNTFPKSKIREVWVDDSVDKELEKMFWDEVDKVFASYIKDGFSVSRDIVIDQVKDYMPLKID